MKGDGPSGVGNLSPSLSAFRGTVCASGSGRNTHSDRGGAVIEANGGGVIAAGLAAAVWAVALSAQWTERVVEHRQMMLAVLDGRAEG